MVTTLVSLHDHICLVILSSFLPMCWTWTCGTESRLRVDFFSPWFWLLWCSGSGRGSFCLALVVSGLFGCRCFDVAPLYSSVIGGNLSPFADCALFAMIACSRCELSVLRPRPRAKKRRQPMPAVKKGIVATEGHDNDINAPDKESVGCWQMLWLGSVKPALRELWQEGSQAFYKDKLSWPKCSQGRVAKLAEKEARTGGSGSMVCPRCGLARCFVVSRSTNPLARPGSPGGPEHPRQRSPPQHQANKTSGDCFTCSRTARAPNIPGACPQACSRSRFCAILLSEARGGALRHAYSEQCFGGRSLHAPGHGSRTCQLHGGTGGHWRGKRWAHWARRLVFGPNPLRCLVWSGLHLGFGWALAGLGGSSSCTGHGAELEQPALGGVSMGCGRQDLPPGFIAAGADPHEWRWVPSIVGASSHLCCQMAGSPLTCALLSLSPSPSHTPSSMAQKMVRTSSVGHHALGYKCHSMLHGPWWTHVHKKSFLDKGNIFLLPKIIFYDAYRQRSILGNPP